MPTRISLDIPDASSSPIAVSSPTFEILSSSPPPTPSSLSSSDEAPDAAYLHIPPVTDSVALPSLPVMPSPVSANDPPEHCAILQPTPIASHNSPFHNSQTRTVDLPRHEHYYLDDGTVTFVVDGTLFKVQRFFLERDSEVFRDMFRDSQHGADGRTDATAIVHDNLREDEFTSLLNFFYNGMYTDSILKSTSEWTNLLSISTRFKFSRIRSRAIYELNTRHELHPVEKVVLARNYSIPDWFQPALEDLVRREAGPQHWESEKLGLATTVSIYMAREAIQRRPDSVHKSSIPSDGERTASSAYSGAGSIGITDSAQCVTRNADDAWPSGLASSIQHASPKSAADDGAALHELAGACSQTPQVAALARAVSDNMGKKQAVATLSVVVRKAEKRARQAVKRAEKRAREEAERNGIVEEVDRLRDENTRLLLEKEHSVAASIRD